MWRISWSSKQELSHTLTKDEEDEIDENRRHFILSRQADVNQTRCHVLFSVFRSSLLTQQCNKRWISRVSERSSEQNLVNVLSEMNLNRSHRLEIFRNSIIKISVRMSIIRISARPKSSSSRRRLRRFHHLRRRDRLSRLCYDHYHWRLRTASYVLLSTLEVTDNDNANERTKSSNNHSHQRDLAARFINQTQA